MTTNTERPDTLPIIRAQDGLGRAQRTGWALRPPSEAMSALDPFALAGIEKIDTDDKDISELAAIAFDALLPGDLAKVMRALSEPEWSETTGTLGVNLRIAAVILGKTKPVLVDAARGLMAKAGESEGDNLCFLTIDRLITAGQHLEALQGMIDAASARMMAAVSVIAIESDDGDAA